MIAKPLVWVPVEGREWADAKKYRARERGHGKYVAEHWPEYVTQFQELRTHDTLAEAQAACERHHQVTAVRGLSAAVPYYGGGVTSEAEIKRVPACPVQAHFGNKDHWIPLETVEAFRQAQPDVEVHVYEADHGFNCDHRGSYNEPAANLALERTLAFFAKHLG